ncbi:membrane protein [Paractinoplanes deccanensis]|uniref:Membrane protein n=1 Tax=Paractinoplanes deccanensis TaxID=113561 RepID=A0ABQ3XX72_9ACTN|nr:PepSY domain-containing protein [Actinoplanes deccanensis]GID72349.1 membrane protein [Actinoplanes deccanensis]
MSTAAPPSAPPSSRSRAQSPSGFVPLLLRLHFYAGVLVAPFLLVAALTGLAYVFSPQIDRILYADELIVPNPAGPTRPVAEQIAAARASAPGGTLVTVRPGEGSATTQVDFALPTLDEDHRRTVYVNPYSGEVTGHLTTWFSYTPVRTWLDDLHRNLHLGAAGRHYSEFAASWLGVITVGGLLLWWRRRRGTRPPGTRPATSDNRPPSTRPAASGNRPAASGRRFGRTVRGLLVPDLAAAKGVHRTRGWHAATGVWLSAGLLILSVTGLTWSRYAGGNFSEALDALDGSRPSVSTSLTGAAATPTGHHGGTAAVAGTADHTAIDGVLKVARDNGLDGPLEVTAPADGTSAWKVAQNDSLWPVRQDSVAVDATAGTVTDRVNFADWPLLAKLTSWGVNAHMGLLFGLPNQILLAALAIGLLCVIVWGYRMWWQRRPTRADRRAPVGAPLGTRGAWQQLPPWAIVAGVPAVIALGWAVPLFGIPLAAFLLFDVATGTIQSRRRKPPAPVSPAPAGS